MRHLFSLDCSRHSTPELMELDICAIFFSLSRLELADIIVFLCIYTNYAQGKTDTETIFIVTDGYNENCLGVRFALCIIKALRLARIEHCSGTVVTPFLPSVYMWYPIAGPSAIAVHGPISGPKKTFIGPWTAVRTVMPQ